jgi:hypothetical protein
MGSALRGLIGGRYDDERRPDEDRDDCCDQNDCESIAPRPPKEERVPVAHGRATPIAASPEVDNGRLVDTVFGLPTCSLSFGVVVCTVSFTQR